MKRSGNGAKQWVPLLVQSDGVSVVGTNIKANTMALWHNIEEAEREAKRQRAIADQQAKLEAKNRKAKHERIAKLLANLKAKAAKKRG
jgi:hypothetical protein